MSEPVVPSDAETRCVPSLADPDPAPEPQPVEVVEAQPCEVCGVKVAAAYIARTGRARHGWHAEGA